MKIHKFFYVALLVMALGIMANSSIYAQDEVMTNDEVIALSKAGLNPSIIINKIRTSKTNFDMSTDALIKLKQAGISDEIVTTMLEAKSGKSLSNNNGNPANVKSAGD